MAFAIGANIKVLSWISVIAIFYRFLLKNKNEMKHVFKYTPTHALIKPQYNKIKFRSININNFWHKSPLEYEIKSDVNMNTVCMKKTGDVFNNKIQ